MSVEEIKFANGQTLKVIDGEYVIGAGGACKQKSCLKGKVMNGEYWMDNCMQKYNCDCDAFKAWYISVFGEDSWEWQDCESITDISIAGTNITNIPESICALVNMKDISVSYNINLTKLPDSMRKLTKIEHLDIGYNCLSQIPNFVYSFKNLISLLVMANKITFISPEIKNLIKLERFWFYYNNITSLPDEICNLTNLKELAGSENKIEKLPNNIGNLIKLETINFSSNKLINLPESIGNLISITEFNFSDNPLIVLPASIKNLDKEDIEIILINCNFTEEYKDYIRNELFPIANANGNLYL